jgi:hypothetical protein
MLEIFGCGHCAPHCPQYVSAILWLKTETKAPQALFMGSGLVQCSGEMWKSKDFLYSVEELKSQDSPEVVAPWWIINNVLRLLDPGRQFECLTSLWQSVQRDGLAIVKVVQFYITVYIHLSDLSLCWLSLYDDSLMIDHWKSVGKPFQNKLGKLFQ